MRAADSADAQAVDLGAITRVETLDEDDLMGQTGCSDRGSEDTPGRPVFSPVFLPGSISSFKLLF